MSNDALPTKVLQLIFSCNTWSDHKTISLVCRRWASAVEPMLLARTCLKVSYREVPILSASVYYGDDYNEYHASLLSSTKLIDRKVLTEARRNYTCFRVEWGDERSDPNMRDLQELLDKCQERFSVKKLYLKAPPGSALTDLFMTRRSWLENLTELQFEQLSTSNEQQALFSAIELSLPKLKQLTWLGCVGYQIYDPQQRNESSVAFLSTSNNEYHRHATQTSPRFHIDINQMQATLDVPQLDRLKVRVKTSREFNWAELISQPSARLELVQPVDQYSLILPSLTLKSCSKLQHIEMLKLDDSGMTINQRSVIQIGNGIFTNLKSLSFIKCTASIMEKICEKCSQLEELFFNEIRRSFSAQLSSIPLKKLTLKDCLHWVSLNQVVFSELRYLRLINTSYGASSINIVSLNAPQLTTIVAAGIDYNLLTITHKEQIRTMVVELNAFESIDSSPPPNVTELFLCLRQGFFRERETFEDYLQHNPNLRRLTIFGKEGSMVLGDLELSLQSFPNLEYLHADKVILRLADFSGLAHLKSLILSNCSIKAKSNDDDGEVLLPTLDIIRVKSVNILGYTTGGHHDADRTWDRFPICGSGRLQPPSLVIETSTSRSYNSPNFQPKRWDEVIPTE